MNKKFEYDICVCGYAFKDIIYKLDNYPVENSNKSYNAEVSYNFGGVFNTLRALRFLNKRIKIKTVTILGKDKDGINGIKELKKLKINHQSVIFNNITNNSLHLINRKTKTKTFIVQFNSKKVKNIKAINDSKWVHFMYLDNKEFLDQFGKLVLKKKKGQFFSADLSKRSISKLDLKKYLDKLDFLICSTKELSSLFSSKKCLDFNDYSIKKLKDLSKIIKFIIVHSKKRSIAFIDGQLIKVSNNNIFAANTNVNITGAGDTYTAFVLCDLLQNKMIDNKSIFNAHKFASDYCIGKLY